MLVGILSFQGDYSKHKSILDKLNVDTMYVTNSLSLNKTDGLIIPGGESSVIANFLNTTKLCNDIKKYSLSKNIFGTCAGAIIMSSKCDDNNIKNLNIINIESFRNSWGRQIDSFEANVNLLFNKKTINAKFIRAPKIKPLSNKIDILSLYKNEPILVRNERHLASTFHPELNSNTSVHEYFLNMIND